MQEVRLDDHYMVPSGFKIYALCLVRYLYPTSPLLLIRK